MTDTKEYANELFSKKVPIYYDERKDGKMFKIEMFNYIEDVVRSYQDDHKHDEPAKLNAALLELRKRMECIATSLCNRYTNSVEIRNNYQKVEKKKVVKDADPFLVVNNNLMLMKLTNEYKVMKKLIVKYKPQVDFNFAPAIDIMTKRGLLSCYQFTQKVANKVIKKQKRTLRRVHLKQESIVQRAKLLSKKMQKLNADLQKIKVQKLQNMSKSLAT